MSVMGSVRAHRVLWSVCLAFGYLSCFPSSVVSLEPELLVELSTKAKTVLTSIIGPGKVTPKREENCVPSTTQTCICDSPYKDAYCARISYEDSLIATRVLKNPLSGTPSFNQMNADIARDDNPKLTSAQKALIDLVMLEAKWRERKEDALTLRLTNLESTLPNKIEALVISALLGRIEALENRLKTLEERVK
jgi:hypothetical protein